MCLNITKSTFFNQLKKCDICSAYKCPGWNHEIIVRSSIPDTKILGK